MQEFGTKLTHFQPFPGPRCQGRNASASPDHVIILFKSLKLSDGKQPSFSEKRFGSLNEMQLQSLKTLCVFSSINCWNHLINGFRKRMRPSHCLQDSFSLLTLYFLLWFFFLFFRTRYRPTPQTTPQTLHPVDGQSFQIISLEWNWNQES